MQAPHQSLFRAQAGGGRHDFAQVAANHLAGFTQPRAHREQFGYRQTKGFWTTDIGSGRGVQNVGIDADIQAGSGQPG